MSAPESILSIAGVQGPTQNTSAESLDIKTNPANAALFVSIMEQYAPGSTSKMESWSARARATRADSAGDTGKVLPAMPAGLPIVPDAALEEFAVDLGIDRSLARLLLRETAIRGTEGVDTGVRGDERGAAFGASAVYGADVTGEALSDLTDTGAIERANVELGGEDVATALIPLPSDRSRAPLSGDLSEGDRPRASTASLVAMRETALGQRSGGAVGAVLASSPIADAGMDSVAPSSIGLGDSPLADEDVLRWRAASARGGIGQRATESTRLEGVFKPLGLDALRDPAGVSPRTMTAQATPPTVVNSSEAVNASKTPAFGITGAAPSPAAPQLPALTVGETASGVVSARGALNAGAINPLGNTPAAPNAAVTPSVGIPQDGSNNVPAGQVATHATAAQNLAQPAYAAGASAISANVAILPAVGLVTKEFGSKNSVPSEALRIDLSTAHASGDPIDVAVAGREMTGLSSDAWLALSASGLRRQGLLGAAASDGASAATSAATSAAGSASLAGATLPSGLLVSHDPAAAQARPIPLPSTMLDYDTRAEQFAEQVGQRLIQQMRADRWTVSLQLDPRNLGPVDIALEIDGSDVRANLAVVNADVRALLEAGMPRLRDTLEMAGYQLSGWSMADSAGRDAAAQQFAQGFIERHTRGLSATSADEAMDSKVSRGDVDGTERGIDLYV